MIKLTTKQLDRLDKTMKAVESVMKKHMLCNSNKQVMIKASFNCGGIRTLEEVEQNVTKINL